MLFKLSLSNIRKSLRDYAIYFVTLVIGVAVFYVFNAIGDQAVYMQVSKSRDDIIELLTNTLAGISVFVAVLLGLDYCICKSLSYETKKYGICVISDAWHGKGKNFSNTVY